jgi:hypothetical protein
VGAAEVKAAAGEMAKAAAVVVVVVVSEAAGKAAGKENRHDGRKINGEKDL